MPFAPALFSQLYNLFFLFVSLPQFSACRIFLSSVLHIWRLSGSPCLVLSFFDMLLSRFPFFSISHTPTLSFLDSICICLFVCSFRSTHSPFLQTRLSPSLSSFRIFCVWYFLCTLARFAHSLSKAFSFVFRCSFFRAAYSVPQTPFFVIFPLAVDLKSLLFNCWFFKIFFRALQIRDTVTMECVPGVLAGDIGPKPGLWNHVDNGEC
jgi:hypothetical protein